MNYSKINNKILSFGGDSQKKQWFSMLKVRQILLGYIKILGWKHKFMFLECMNVEKNVL